MVLAVTLDIMAPTKTGAFFRPTLPPLAAVGLFAGFVFQFPFCWRC